MASLVVEDKEDGADEKLKSGEETKEEKKRKKDFQTMFDV